MGEQQPALAWMVASLRARQPGSEALTLARHALLDTAACIVAGRNSGQLSTLDAMLAASGEAGLGTMALKLGVAAHAHDFDDYEEPASTHPSAVLVPALLALASKRAGIPLRDLLAAYIAGYEVILTLGKVLGYSHYMAGWHSTSTLARPGAAMAAARLLDLGQAETVTALSIAMTQSAGLKTQFGTDTKALHASLSARSGVEAALLAQVGFTASPEIADAEYGFAALFGTALSPGWGEVKASGLPSISDHPPFVKPSPSCGYTIRPIEAAAKIAAMDGFDAGAIQRITIRMPEPYYRVAGFRKPGNAHEARFSTAYCVAVALADGDVGVAAFEPAALNRSDVRQLMAMVDVDAYELPANTGDMSPDAPDTVTVALDDGRVLTQTVALARGGPGRLLSGDEIAFKYAACGGDPRTATALLRASLDEPMDIRTLIEPS
jgi:2-methylcitrate dehydratase PrpD